MKAEYAKLREAMATWYEEIDVPVIQIVHAINDEGEVKIAGYKDFPNLRKILAGEIKEAAEYYARRGENGPLTVSIVYSDPNEPLAVYINGEFYGDLDEHGVS